MISKPTLEANICRHCMNHCTACSHASAFAKPYFMEPKQLERDLRIFSKFMHVRQFFALGGEPLLHPKICEILDIVKSSGICDCVGVLTNGRLFDRMPEEFWTKLGYLRVSVYPNLDPKQMDYARQKSKQYQFGLGFDGITHFYKQFKRVPDKGENFPQCPWKGSCITIHDGHFYLCPNAAFFPDSFMGLPQNTDGLPIDDDLTEQKVLDYLNRTTPFVTCSICHCFKELMPWQESKTREDWIRDSTL